MPVSSGSRLGPYELISPLGEGGMGEVWKARDTRLDRSVAIKLLLQSAANDPQLRERLAREARAISALAHPNICPLYDLGTADDVDFLVMELLDGETLADRIARGPVPVRQAIEIATQIALGLHAAHRAGIVHRDLKPGNVMLTRNGARLLDFGLARPLAGVDSHASTRVDPLTREGTIVGTVRYMAPEQIEGNVLDARTDVFAFGLVLQEMLTGQPAFAGSSYAGLMAAILTAEPQPLLLGDASFPPALKRVVRRCLEKDPEDRWQSMRDLAEALRWSEEDKNSVNAVSQRRKVKSYLPVWIGLLTLLVLSLAWMAYWKTIPRLEVSGPLTARFAISPPPGTSFVQFPVSSELAVSPDGRHLALIALEGRRRKLFVRRLDAIEAKAVPGTEEAASPFWSPDGKWIAFFAGGAMKKVSVDGGPVHSIAKLQGGWGSWSGDRILVSEWGTDTSASILMISAAGGSASSLTEGKDAWDVWPAFLSDGEHYVFFRRIKNPPRGGEDESGIYIGSVRDRSVRRLLPVRSRAEVRGNTIVYVRDAVLVKQKLDLDRMAVVGEPEEIATQVFCFTPTAAANFSTSRDGRVVAWQRAPLDTQLVWRDFGGRELGRTGEPQPYRNFALSPDGTRVAADLFDKVTQTSNIWLMDVARGLKTKIARSAPGTSSPLWFHRRDALIVSEPDSRDGSAAPNLSVLSLADGSTERLLEEDGPQYVTAITKDDSAVVYSVNRGVRSQIEMITIPVRGKPTPLGSQGESDDRDGTISPDEQWLAYQSDESGQPEVYARRFRRASESIRISSRGGTQPQWATDGRSLFFLDPAGMLMRAAFAAGEPLRVMSETSLFRVTAAGMMEFDAFGSHHYAVWGDRVLVREIAGGDDVAPVTVLVTH